MHGHAGAEVYCQEFAHWIAIGEVGKAFKGDVKTNKVALLNLIPMTHNFNWAVILIYSKAAIQAVTSHITPKVPSIIECRHNHTR